MPYNDVAVFVYHCFYLFQVICLDVMLMSKDKFRTVPHVFCIAVFAYRMHMNRLVVTAKNKKEKP